MLKSQEYIIPLNFNQKQTEFYKNGTPEGL